MLADTVAFADTSVARPRFIAGAGRPLFVWHHAPPPHLRRGGGVVLCPPLGYESMSAYAALRILAERLAALGFDTLRFDYDGTGNSAGSQEDPNRVEAWLRSIECAIAEARGLSASNSVALVGVRAGALMALRAAAASGSVERLVLWSPFPSGRAYVRELKACARLLREKDADEDAGEPGINATGYIMAPETVAALERLTLDALTLPPATRVLLVDRDDRPVDTALADRLEALGSYLTRIRPPGTASMLEQPQLATVPEQALADIVAWLSDWPVSPAAAAGHDAGLGQGDARRMVRDDYEERAVRFGSQNRLFGVLTSPSDDTIEAPAVVLLNTGVEYHVGPHRLYVQLARQWAAKGHVVFRFDLGGIGDSRPAPGAGENIVYPEHMLDDLCDAIAFVRKETPRRPVIVAGLCSGGWLAFRAAREGLPVAAIVPINPPMFLLDAAGVQWATDRDELQRYKSSMLDPAKWVKALRGNVSYASLMRVAAQVWGRRATVRVNGVLHDAMRDGLAKDLCGIADRGIRSLFVFSRGDDGLDYFRQYAQPALDNARVGDLIRHVVVEGAGHTFRPRAAQRALREILTDFVTSQSPVLSGADAHPETVLRLSNERPAVGAW